jgi:hypothetical protein
VFYNVFNPALQQLGFALLKVGWGGLGVFGLGQILWQILWQIMSY